MSEEGAVLFDRWGHGGRVAEVDEGIRVRDRAEEAKTEHRPSPRGEVQPADSPAVQTVQLEQFSRWLVLLALGFTFHKGAAFWHSAERARGSREQSCSASGG